MNGRFGRFPALVTAGVALSVCAASAATGTGGLVYSTASNAVVQRQPRAGSCHAIGSGLYSRPDPRCTPGALDPAVTQATIDRTICVRGWTATVRPPVGITEPEKFASMAAYGDRGSAGDYEYDHLVPLELGGATNDARNLWPEPGASPNPKDAVEWSLNQAVCDRRMSLARAQQLIARNWVVLAPTHHSRSPGTSSGAARCTVSASYNATYSDYDVYVHSNQPDRRVTVTGANGGSASWSTDGSGYADVYFHAPAGSAERVTARVGAAVCSTFL